MATTEELLSPLKALRKALEERDISALRRLSNSAIDSSAFGDGDDFFLLALTSYMLAKLITKTHYWGIKEKARFISGVLKKLDSSIPALEQGDAGAYEQAMQQLINEMRSLELSDPRFVHNLEMKARTKLASQLYAQGFSLSRAVAITGTHKRDLLQFTGRTLIADRTGRTKTMEARLEHVRRIFE